MATASHDTPCVTITVDVLVRLERLQKRVSGTGEDTYRIQGEKPGPFFPESSGSIRISDIDCPHTDCFTGRPPLYDNRINRILNQPISDYALDEKRLVD